MLLKKDLHERSAAIERSVGAPVNLSAPAAGIAPAKPRVAVFVAHGMGQQVPFETLDNIAEGLARAAGRHSGTPVAGIRARTVQIDDIKTQRTEFDMKDATGADVEVHVYEAYWAPFTEGQINLRDVMSFLLRAGLNGLLNCGSTFQRWLFGGVVSFGKQKSSALMLAATLAAVLSLAVLNAVIALAAGDRLLNPVLHGNNPTVIPPATFDALTSLTGAYLLGSLLVGGVLGALYYGKRSIKSPSTNKSWQAVNACAEVLLWAWVPFTIATAVIAALLLGTHLFPPELLRCRWLSKVWILVWGALLVASWFIRGVLVQYMGDVAAYVSAHWLDRFNDLRKKIKDAAFKQAKAVYSVPDYQRIAMVGHSLGSVITYDTLNALINEDVIGKAQDLAGNPLDVVRRTRLLLTFGSPLDKTAFIFATQWANTTATREALAASLQPMITDYLPYRNIKWINVHAPRDIVCAHLDFYDDDKNPHAAGRTIDNVPDPDALIPLIAHVEYWQNETLFDKLYANI